MLFEQHHGTPVYIVSQRCVMFYSGKHDHSYATAVLSRRRRHRLSQQDFFGRDGNDAPSAIERARTKLLSNPDELGMRSIQNSTLEQGYSITVWVVSKSNVMRVEFPPCLNACIKGRDALLRDRLDEGVSFS